MTNLTQNTPPTIVFISCAASLEILTLVENADGLLSETCVTALAGHNAPPTSFPFCLSPDRKHLYAATRDGLTYSFLIERETGALRQTGKVAFPFGGVCNTVDPTGRYLLTSSYHSNLVSSVRLEKGAVVAERTPFVLPGISKAHGIFLDPRGTFAYCAASGADAIVQIRIDEHTGRLLELGRCQLAEGTGPRHLAFTPDGHYLYSVNESANSITAFALDETTGEPAELQTVRIAHDQPGANRAADIHVRQDGSFLFASLRSSAPGDASAGDAPSGRGSGPGFIGVFQIDVGTGRLRHVETTKTVEGPRSFAVRADGKELIALGQSSQNFEVFSVDHASGRLRTRRIVPSRGNPTWIRYG